MKLLAAITFLLTSSAFAQPVAYCFDALLMVDQSTYGNPLTFCLQAKAVETQVKMNGVAYLQTLIAQVQAEQPPVVIPPPPPPVLTFPPMTNGLVTAVDMIPGPPAGFIMSGYVKAKSGRIDIKDVLTGFTYFTVPTVIAAAPAGQMQWVWKIPATMLDGRQHPLIFKISAPVYAELDNASTAAPWILKMP